ncbi:MAG: ribonuclease P protein component, partial [Deltaproteobacteria bacterium]|nr:ribonuclease P protein component [Deltaproteobacteria bacterium]
KKNNSKSLGYSKRLHHPIEYGNFFGKSEMFKFSECIVYRVKNSCEHFRLGITLKAKGPSVQRNKTKRQIREVFRNFGEKLGNYDYNVVIPSYKKLDKRFPDALRASLLKEISNMFRQKKSHVV